jgi:hypothetical protein
VNVTNVLHLSEQAANWTFKSLASQSVKTHTMLRHFQIHEEESFKKKKKLEREGECFYNFHLKIIPYFISKYSTITSSWKDNILSLLYYQRELA